MMLWREEKPDFCWKPIGDLLERLPFTTAAAVVLGGGRAPRVVLSHELSREIWAHLDERDVEMGGLLIGRVYDLYSDGTQFVVSVEDYVRSDAYKGTAVSLSMEAQVWNDARLKARTGQSVIGWYHSHPNLGVFFSGTDRRTQSAFFNHDHCLGLVIDPIRREEMWFIGGNSTALGAKQILGYSAPSNPAPSGSTVFAEGHF
jgi:proteasome lid subunit RPN8/RPN11